MDLLSFDQALAVVLDEAHSQRLHQHRALSEEVALLDAAGRVLASEVRADRNQPPFDRATRDGYAVIAYDSDSPRRTVGLLRAGQKWTGPQLQSGEAIQIMTGAPMPAGSDAVVMVEHVTVVGQELRLAAGRAPHSGANVVAAGTEARVGELLLAPGARIGAAEIALAAACGLSKLTVYRRPSVAIVATGDELVELDQIAADEQIRNSNSYTLAAMVAQTGGAPARLAIARDTLDEVRARITQGRSSELLILSGGVSMGEYDLVEQVLAELGARFFFTGVRMQPGKPVVFGLLPPTGSLPPCYFFGLPGNPISTQVTFLCFAAPLLRSLSGEPAFGPNFVLATMSGAQAAKPGLTRLLPARRNGTEVSPVGWQGSGDQTANARADCYVELKPEREYCQGDTVRILLR